MSGAMGGSASEEFLAAAPVGEDTFVGCPECDYAANAEAVTHPGAAGRRPSTACPAMQVLDTPDTPTIETLVDVGQRARAWRPADWHRRGHAQERRASSRPRRADESELLVVGVPGDREVDLKRLEAALAPADGRALRGRGLRRPPRPGARLHRPADPGQARHPLPGRPPGGDRHVLGHRRERAGQARGQRGRAGATSSPTARSRRPRSRAGDPCPRAAGGSTHATAASRSGTSSSSAASTPTRSPLDALGPDGKPIRITMGSYGIGVSRLVAAIAEQHHDELGLVWPREVAPADVHIVATGKDDQIEARRRARPRSSTRPGCGCSSTTARRLARREVHRRRAARRADHRRGRPRARLRRGRGQGPETGERTEVALASAVENL